MAWFRRYITSITLQSHIQTSASRGRTAQEVLEAFTHSGPYQYYEAAGKRIVIGTPGSLYGIMLSNRTKHTVEVVASVDSLDVLDGKTASVGKRGYVIPAKSELAMEGFRGECTEGEEFCVRQRGCICRRESRSVPQCRRDRAGGL